jgi:hypothetical protein
MARRDRMGRTAHLAFNWLNAGDRELGEYR